MNQPITEKTEAETERLNAVAESAVLHVRVIGNRGLSRVLEGWQGMMLQAMTFTPGLAGPVAHCLDRRYPSPGSVHGYQTWSIPADGYEVVA